MYTHKLMGRVTGLLLAVLLFAPPLHAHKVVVHGPAGANDILLTLKLDTLNRDSTNTVCRVALTQALNEEDLNVVTDRGKADVELVVNGGIITITQGRAGQIGKALLSYSAELKDKHGRVIMSLVGEESGDSAAEACAEAAEEIADEVEDALDD